jgi:DNA-binding response OmpR family regulator
VRLAMHRFLGRNGWQVQEARDGSAGLELAQQEAWDVIVCDVNLPGISGMELYDRLQANDPARIRSVLLVSGDSHADSVVEFRKRTGATILQKPFELADFRRAVEQAAGISPPDAA